jgi:hypothetical protein
MNRGHECTDHKTSILDLKTFFFLSHDNFFVVRKNMFPCSKTKENAPQTQKNPLYTFRESCLFVINHIVVFYGLET